MLRRRSAPRHEHDDAAGVAGEEQRRLAGAVGAADDVDVLALAVHGLVRGGAVVDAAAGEVVDARRRQPGVADAGGQHDGQRGDLGAVGEAHDPAVAARLDAGDLGGGEDLDVEAQRLVAGALGELGAGQALAGSRGSSRSGCSARPARRSRRARPAACAGPRWRRRPPRRARPGRRRRRRGRRRGCPPSSPGRPARPARAAWGGAAPRRRAAGRPAGRPGRRRSPAVSQQPPAVVAAHVEVAEGHLVAGEELLGRLRLGRPLVAEQR